MELNDIIEKIKKLKSENKIKDIEKLTYHMRVTPELFSHDELKYYINSLVGIKLIFQDESEEVVKLYEENLVEMIGLELELDLEDYLDFDNEKEGYLKAKKDLEEIYSKVV